MQIHKYTEKSGKWREVNLTMPAIRMGSNASGFNFKYRTAEADFQITLSPQECAAWLGEIQIAAKQVEGNANG